MCIYIFSYSWRSWNLIFFTFKDNFFILNQFENSFRPLSASLIRQSKFLFDITKLVSSGPLSTCRPFWKFTMTTNWFKQRFFLYFQYLYQYLAVNLKTRKVDCAHDCAPTGFPPATFPPQPSLNRRRSLTRTSPEICVAATRTSCLFLSAVRYHELHTLYLNFIHVMSLLSVHTLFFCPDHTYLFFSFSHCMCRFVSIYNNSYFICLLFPFYLFGIEPFYY